MIDRREASRIVEANYAKIHGICRSMLRDSYVAEEVTQDVFVFFIENSEGLEDINISAWLINVAKNKIHEYNRSHRSELKNEVPLSEDLLGIYLSDEVYDLNEYEIDDDEILKRKEKIINSLTREERELFIYIYEQKLQYGAVAKLLNITEKNTGVRAVRLRKKIKNIVGDMFVVAIIVAVKMKLV